MDNLKQLQNDKWQEYRVAKVNEIIEAASNRFNGMATNMSLTLINGITRYCLSNEEGRILFEFYWNGNSGSFSAYLDDTAVLFTDTAKLIGWLNR